MIELDFVCMVWGEEEREGEGDRERREETMLASLQIWKQTPESCRIS